MFNVYDKEIFIIQTYTLLNSMVYFNISKLIKVAFCKGDFLKGGFFIEWQLSYVAKYRNTNTLILSLDNYVRPSLYLSIHVYMYRRTVGGRWCASTAASIRSSALSAAAKGNYSKYYQCYTNDIGINNDIHNNYNIILKHLYY